ARRLQLPEAETDLRTPADRGPHRPGLVHLPAALPLEPAGLSGDPWESPGHPHRALPRVCRAAVHRRREGATPGAQARDRRLRGPDRDGGDTGRRDRSGIWGTVAAGGGGGSAECAGGSRGLGESAAGWRGLCSHARQRRAAPLGRVVAATAGSGRALGSPGGIRTDVDSGVVSQKNLVIATIAADLAVTDLTMPREDWLLISCSAKSAAHR